MDEMDVMDKMDDIQTTQDAARRFVEAVRAFAAAWAEEVRKTSSAIICKMSLFAKVGKHDTHV